MKQVKINWTELKRDYLTWREELYRITKELLTSSDRVELSKYNNDGYFHHVSETKHFRLMQEDYERNKRVPEEWLSKGNHPGIWTAMFNPHNTYSRAHLPIQIIRFYFKDGFFVYDRENPNHEKLLASWNGRGRKNPWKTLRNNQGLSLGERMESHEYPSHKGFYIDNKFGALIGYSDYISPVIVLEDAIEKIEFLEL